MCRVCFSRCHLANDDKIKFQGHTGEETLSVGLNEVVDMSRNSYELLCVDMNKILLNMTVNKYFDP